MFNNNTFFRVVCLFVLLVINSVAGHSQKSKADSILKLIRSPRADSNIVNLAEHFADSLCEKKPDTALIISLEAISLAKKINYENPWLLSICAKSYSKLGNFPRALEIDFQLLEKEEKRKERVPQQLATVLMSIGNVYNNMGDYRKALEYYLKSDTIIRKSSIDYLSYFSLSNIGDAYDKLDILDSAFLYYYNSKRKADSSLLDDKTDDLPIGPTLLGLAQIYRKQSNFILSLKNYDSAITTLRSEGYDKLRCDAYLGLATLYYSNDITDQAILNAYNSYELAKTGDFPAQQMNAAKFLRQIYNDKKKYDSAFAYAMIEKDLNDTLNSVNRIRELQIISSNEVTRQLEMAEAKRKAEKEWKNRLQQLLIGIFIPAFFLFTLVLSRVNLNIRAIKLLGIFSLLFFFEYLTLFLHPTVARLTNHTPIYEILIFVAIAAILIPMHHKAEHWLIQKLLHHREHAKHKKAEHAVNKNT